MRRINIIAISILLACNAKFKNTTQYKSMLDSETNFTVTDSKGVKHKVFELTTKEFNRYMRKGSTGIDPFPGKDMKVFKTKDGKVIVSEHNMASLYPSLEVLQDVVNEFSQNSVRAVMYNKNPFGKEFPEHVDSLISSMLSDFRLDAKQYTDENLLKAVDKIINKKRTVAFFDKYYLSFIAFVGQMAIKKLSGEWLMVLSSDGVTWTPCLKINGKDIFFVNYISQDVYNLNLQKPLEESYESVAGVSKN